MTDVRTTEEMNTLIQHVLDQAKQRAERTVAQAQKEADQLLRQADEKARARQEERVQEGMDDVDQVRRQIISQAQLKFRRELLEIRADMIRQAQDEIRNRLEDLCAKDGDRYFAFLMELLEGALDDEAVDRVVLCLSERDAERYKEQIPAALAKALNIKTVEIRTSPMDGGVIVEIPSRRLQIDISFDELMQDVVPEIERIVEDEVFVPLQTEEKEDG